MRMEEIKKMAKFLSFSSFNASSPMISFRLTFSLALLVGGVLGKVKLNNPKTSEAIR